MISFRWPASSRRRLALDVLALAAVAGARQGLAQRTPEAHHRHARHQPAAGHGLPWSPAHPTALVICCSDGRFQAQTDAYLQSGLQLDRYDRLYVPGGPGALASSGAEFARQNLYAQEALFLIKAHHVADLVLIFHSGTADGPASAMCADYVRKLPGRTVAQLRAQQVADAKELLRPAFGWPSDLRIRVYRAEVGPDSAVHFVRLADRAPAAVR